MTVTTPAAAGMPWPRILVSRRLWLMAYAAGMASYLDAAALLTLSASLTVWRERFALSSLAVGVLAGGFGFAIAAGALVGGWLGTVGAQSVSSPTTWCSSSPVWRSRCWHRTVPS